MFSKVYIAVYIEVQKKSKSKPKSRPATYRSMHFSEEKAIFKAFDKFKNSLV